MTKKTTEPPRVRSFSVRSEKQHILRWIDEMAERERKSKSEIVIRCVEYYYRNKWPGNPQPPLFSPVKPEFVKLRDARLRQTMTFLRFKSKLPYKWIAQIVGRSYKFVYSHCKGLEDQLHLNFDGRRVPRKKILHSNFKRSLRTYRKRFHAFLEGKIESVEEAFTF